MNTIQMRVALEKKYGKSFVAGKKDDQVIAIFRRLQSQNKI